jgi:type I restriction enzyme S subunit
VPKLRFPEFRGAWVTKTLGTQGYFTGGGTPSKENETYWTGEIPWISSSDLIEDSISQIRINRFITKQAVQDSATKLVPAKSILLISRVGVGKLAVSTFPLCTSQDFTNFTPTDADPLFLAYLLKSQKETLLSFNQGTSIKGFTKDNIASLRLGFPSPAEQQKIAECLSSVDELMAAQARKVDALKTHKKGLMQQLFPREGETQPRLRFPEFQNAGEWVVEELSKCLKKVIDYRGKAPPKAESGVPLITAKNVRFGWLDMTNDEYIEEDKYEEWMSRGIPHAGDILFTTEAPLGNVALFPREGKYALGQRLLTLRAKPDRCIPAFLFHSLLGPTMQEDIDFHGTGSTAKGIKSKVFVKLSFWHPGVQEQQRIATCLSSLDALITAETQKHEALKTHKKGLMQQLFPSPEEIES